MNNPADSPIRVYNKDSINRLISGPLSQAATELWDGIADALSDWDMPFRMEVDDDPDNEFATITIDLGLDNRVDLTASLETGNVGLFFGEVVRPVTGIVVWQLIALTMVNKA